MKSGRKQQGGIALLLCVLLIGLSLPAWGETAGRLQKTDGVITYDAELTVPEGVTAYPIIPCQSIVPQRAGPYAKVRSRPYMVFLT